MHRMLPPCPPQSPRVLAPHVAPGHVAEALEL